MCKLSGTSAGHHRRQTVSTAMFRAEVADVLSQVLLLASYHKIDVVEEIRGKWLVFADDAPPSRTTALPNGPN